MRFCENQFEIQALPKESVDYQNFSVDFWVIEIHQTITQATTITLAKTKATDIPMSEVYIRLVG